LQQGCPRITVQTDAVQQTTNQLILSLPGKPDPSACAAAGLDFQLDHALSGASIDFISPNGGTYTLTITDQTGTQLAQ